MAVGLSVTRSAQGSVVIGGSISSEVTLTTWSVGPGIFQFRKHATLSLLAHIQNIHMN
ncbi:unnamed protein product, partial [Ceratitis capitata]